MISSGLAGIAATHCTHQSLAGLDQRPIHAVHLVIQSASVAQIVPGAVAPPQRRRDRSAVDTFASLAELKVHCTLVRGGALESRRIVGTAPWRGHHDRILCVELCRQLTMCGAKAICGPSRILCRCCCGATKLRCHMIVLTIRGHIQWRRLLVVIATDGASCASSNGCQIRISGCRRGAAAVVHLGAGGGGGNGGHLQLHVMVVAAELWIIPCGLLIRCGLQEGERSERNRESSLMCTFKEMNYNLR